MLRLHQLLIYLKHFSITYKLSLHLLITDILIWYLREISCPRKNCINYSVLTY